MVDIRLITEIYDSNTILFNFLGVLLLGYLGGFLVKNTILRVSKIMGLDEIMKSSKIQMVFKELGYKGTAINLIADVVKWFVYLLALSSAFEILSMHEISTIFAVIVRYIPNIAIAITVIVIGIFAADLSQESYQSLSQQAIRQARCQALQPYHHHLQELSFT